MSYFKGYIANLAALSYVEEVKLYRHVGGEGRRLATLHRFNGPAIAVSAGQVTKIIDGKGKLKITPQMIQLGAIWGRR